MSSLFVHKVPLPRIRFAALTTVWNSLLNGMFDPYRPELHYMRGPGPKWLAKHPEMRP